MSNEIHFDFSSLQNIIVILLIIGIGIYVYFELNKIKKNITEIEFELYNIKRANNLINEEYQNNDTQENINDTNKMFSIIDNFSKDLKSGTIL